LWALHLRVRRAIAWSLDRLARGLGYDIVPRSYHSVVTRVDEVPAEVWTRRSPMHGIDFDVPSQLEWAQRELGPFIAEFAAEAPADWSDSNEYYESADPEILYAIIRSRRPGRIVELGSGFSSQVIAAACRVNAREGAPSRYVAYDPCPRPELTGSLEGMEPVRTLAAQDVPLSAFTDLADGDVLVVDTTHTVKPGGDVNRIVLDILPLLAPGVMVHFHDVFLPGEYHRHWVAMGLHWAEAYLVQAFLCLNPHFVVRFGANAVWLDHQEELRALVPSLGTHRPTAFWIERVEA
jgi:hypothetical protein